MGIVKAAIKTVAKSAKKPEVMTPEARQPEPAAVPPVALIAGTVEMPRVLPDLKTEAAPETKPAAEVKKAATPFAKKPLPFDGSKFFTWVGPCPSKEGTKRAARYATMQAMSGGTLKDLAEKVPARYVGRALKKGTIKV
jgi:hypothetical protein